VSTYLDEPRRTEEEALLDRLVTVWFEDHWPVGPSKGFRERMRDVVAELDRLRGRAS
jgi:hypothetical protein